jgi:hypothetical protein
MAKKKLLSRTHFEKKFGENSDRWQWFWRTMSANDVDSVAVGGEGYNNLVGAINGFMAGQGLSDWEPGQPAMPDGYTMEKFDPQHYVITHHGEE